MQLSCSLGHVEMLPNGDVRAVNDIVSSGTNTEHGKVSSVQRVTSQDTVTETFEGICQTLSHALFLPVSNC